VTVSSGNMQTDTINVGVGVTTSFKNSQNTINSISLYPIPTNGNLTLFLKDTGYESLTVYNGIGEELFSKLLNSGDVNSTIPIDMSKYLAGTYFVKVSSTSGEVIKTKIILQK
jgi:hypothetical protein